MKIGVLGTGGIVRSVTPTLQRMKDIECYAIASRTLERAEKAAEEYSYEKAYGNYEELVADPLVELVYVATPHSRHYDDMKLCIAHGKPVICEKSFTMNAKQAKEIRELAKEAGVFVTEAIWPRYMPSRTLIQDTIDSGIIGTVSTLTANLSYIISGVKRIQDPELAGGALLDVGVYGINFALMHFGEEIERIESSVQMTETGVDAMESITIFYKNGRMAVLTHGIYGRSDRKGIFYGDKGYIIVENINNPQSVTVYDTEDRLVKQIPVPEQISGYEYQFEECRRCIAEKKTESDSMPLKDSVYMMELMDRLRAQWGLVYPQERI
ncbi:MAG: Gfo/Idh/MocA family oxidoreductase [Lachnospiraceae bacterium]|nr:Gfo/Idh/MocA family oxidoreductase [Lachnospiraceae bacterium]